MIKAPGNGFHGSQMDNAYLGQCNKLARPPVVLAAIGHPPVSPFSGRAVFPVAEIGVTLGKEL